QRRAEGLLGETPRGEYRRLVDLDSAHVIVTGGAAGIGAAAGRAFARAGARAVVLADLDGEQTAAVAAELVDERTGAAAEQDSGGGAAEFSALGLRADIG